MLVGQAKITRESIIVCYFIILDVLTLLEILHEADPTDEADPPHLPRLEEQVK
jgi:hypothetical protein